jgi:hypothetical protein
VNWKIFSLALILFVTGSLTGAFLHHWGFSNGHGDAVAALKPTIDKAIDKETIKNEIKNEIQIDKIKKSDSIKIILDPKNNQEPINVISKDCPEGSVCMPLENLTRRQKRRLKLE